jgi:hypothetical protein
MKRVLMAAALVAAFGTTAAQAQPQDWSQFLGVHAAYPTRLADQGLAVDRTNDEIAVQAFHDPYGSNEHIHEYRLDAMGSLLPWGLFGRNDTDTVLEPSGVDVAGGHRVSWIERGNAFTTTNDHVYGMPNGSTWPSWEFSVTRFNGHIVAIASDAAGGAYLLRVFEPDWTSPQPRTFELISLGDTGALRWRKAFGTCGVGWVPARLTLDIDPATATLTVAGSCGQNSLNRYVFAQRVDADTGVGSQQINLPFVGSQFHDLAFTRSHTLMAVATTRFGLVEVHRLLAGATAREPIIFADPTIDASALHALTASGGDDMLLVADGARSPVVQRFTPAGPQPPFLLDALAGQFDWRVVASADGRIAALRTSASNGVSYLTTLLLDADGALQREHRIGGLVASVGPRVVTPTAGGFVVAVDRRRADGTIGVAVERIVEASETGTIELP